MIKHTQTIRWQQPMNCLSVFDYSVGLALKGLKLSSNIIKIVYNENLYLEILNNFGKPTCSII